MAKKIRKVQPKTFSLTIGLTLCLFAVVLVINVGYFARVFAFPILYLFGIGSYLFYYWALYTNGILILYRDKGLKTNIKTIIGNIFFFAGVSMLITLISTKDAPLGADFLDKYNSIYFGVEQGQMNSVGGYFNIDFINMFSEFKVGGGIVGYALVGLINSSINVTVSWVITIIALVIAFLCLFLEPLIKAIKWLQVKIKGSQGDTPNEPKKEKPVKEEPKLIHKKDVFVTNENKVIKDAKNISSDYRSEVQGIPNLGSQLSNADFNNRNYHEQEPVHMTNNYSGNQTFRPARFTRASIELYDKKDFDTPHVQPQPTYEPIKEEKHEQMSLDFDAKPEINRELASARPEFAAFETVDSPNQNIPEPVEEERPMPQPVTFPNPVPVQQVQPSVTPAPAPVIKPKKVFKWIAPSSDILQEVKSAEASERNNQVAEERKAVINETFADFGVGAQCFDFTVGPSVTRFKISYEHNVSVKSVNSLIADISVRLEGVAARFESIVEGMKYSSLEVPNAVITPVSFKEVYEALPPVKEKPLAVAFGKNIEGQIVWAELNEFPHLLVAGTTGSGKSVFTHSIISSLIMRNSPENLKLVLIDPKKVELNTYKEIPHLACPVITKPKDGKAALVRLAKLMDERYEMFDTIDGIRNIKDYNEYADENKIARLPYIICVIDEYADLVDNCKDVSQPVVSLVQKARTAGIHLIIATQRPSTNVITGVIKGNLPTRVALSVASQVDSITILGESGAEKLLGKGDMLVQTPLVSRVGNVRLQSCFISSKDLSHIVGYLKAHYEVDYDERFLNLDQEEEQPTTAFVDSSGEYSFNAEDDEEKKYKDVKAWVMANKYMSLSKIQRECSVGFNRAGRFFKRLQNEGIVAEFPEGNKGCPVLVNEETSENNGGTGDGY